MERIMEREDLTLDELTKYLKNFQVPESLKELATTVCAVNLNEDNVGTAFCKFTDYIEKGDFADDIKQLALTAYAKKYEDRVQQEVKATAEKNLTGEMIKRFRMQRGFSQTQLADVLGVSNKAISKWESGSGLPDIAYLVPLADALGVSTDVLLGR